MEEESERVREEERVSGDMAEAETIDTQGQVKKQRKGRGEGKGREGRVRESGGSGAKEEVDLSGVPRPSKEQKQILEDYYAARKSFPFFFV